MQFGALIALRVSLELEGDKSYRPFSRRIPNNGSGAAWGSGPVYFVNH
jgi:hypothetical protein